MKHVFGSNTESSCSWSEPLELDTVNKELDTLVGFPARSYFMSARGPYRSHSPQFKIQLCTDIRRGKMGRREAQREYRISANLVQLWLTQYDRGELDAEEAAAATVAEYEARIGALEHKVGQLTMELDLV